MVHFFKVDEQTGEWDFLCAFDGGWTPVLEAFQSRLPPEWVVEYLAW